jgi:release factor glutamine methyltransferase
MDVLKQAAIFLENNKIEDARFNAERLLSHILGIARMDLYLQFERPLSPDERNAYKMLLKRRAAHEPLQYIIGQTEFMSLPFRVTPDVLIPRPETELLVEKAMEEVEHIFGTQKQITCLDIGTGCGNIAVSLAHYLQSTTIWAVDIEEAALTIARENALKNGVNESIHFLQIDAIQKDFCQKIGKRFDVVVSNPPYVSESEFENLPLEIKEFEPKRALDGGKDGLQFYRALSPCLNDLMKEPGVALSEIGANQAEGVIQIFSENFAGKIQTSRDYAHRDRIVILHKP